jgi:hypothetical protein
MKVFWVLEWSNYYPRGGLGNVHSQHETLEEAEKIVEQLKAGDPDDHIEIEDVSEMLGIERGRY